MKRPRIVTIGGGTGHYALLTGLRDLDADLTAVVTMMDSGGSSGRLRDEYGILPPGDFTRCLVALSQHPEAMKELLGHRFVGGALGVLLLGERLGAGFFLGGALIVAGVLVTALKSP